MRLAELVNLAAFVLERILDRVADRHRDDERPPRIERIAALPFVAAIARNAAGPHDARRHVEHHLRPLAEPELGRKVPLGMRRHVIGIEMQRVAHGQVGPLDQRSREALAAIAVIGHVTGVFGERPYLMGLVRTAREDDVAAQVAARKVERHPADRVADRSRLHIAGIEDVHVIAAVGLVVFQQLGAMLLHPRFERHILELVERFGLLLRAGTEQQQTGRRKAQGTQFHISSHSHSFSIGCRLRTYSTLSTVKNHAIGLSRGIVPKFRSPKAML